MTNGNADQIEFWNGEHGRSWARYADIVDIMFAEITDAILDAASVGIGDRVLDLGCGSGGTTLVAAERVTIIGSVTAIDISAPMIEHARARAAQAAKTDAHNLTFVMGDASSYPFVENSFDAVVSRLGSMFFEDPEETFQRIAPAIKPGGRIALGVWRGPRENLWAMAPVSATRDFLAMPPRPGPEDPGPFSFADPDRVRPILMAAGLKEIDFTPLDYRIPLGRTLEEALNFTLEMGPLSAPLAAVTGDSRAKAIDTISGVLKDNQDDDGVVRLAGACWIVTARAS
jgi:SAM-dependent methyltransferase